MTTLVFIDSTNLGNRLSQRELAVLRPDRYGSTCCSAIPKTSIPSTSFASPACCSGTMTREARLLSRPGWLARCRARTADDHSTRLHPARLFGVAAAKPRMKPYLEQPK